MDEKETVKVIIFSAGKPTLCKIWTHDKIHVAILGRYQAVMGGSCDDKSVEIHF